MPQSPLARAVLVFCIGLALLLLGIVGYLYATDRLRESVDETSSGTAQIGGPFQLVNQRNEPVTAADFQGGYALVYFGYTYCPDICPTSLLEMTQALDMLEETAPAKAETVTPVFITVDPARDTVAAMRDYATHFHEDLVALTGSETQVADAAAAYRVYYSKVPDESGDPDAYLVDHSSFIFLMGPNGDYVTHFGHDADAETIAEGLQERVEG